MNAIALTSLLGAPGVTTTCLGLALQWPQDDVVLIEADPSAPQAIAAGYLGGNLPRQGLMSFMEELRRNHRPPPLEPHLTNLDDGGGCRFLPGFSAPSAAAIFTGWPAVFGALGHCDAVVDLGRTSAASVPSEVLRHCGVLGVVTRTSLRSLVGLAGQLTQFCQSVEQHSPGTQIGLVLVGPGRPYSAAEVSGELGLPVLFEVPFSPDEAAVLSDAAPAPRRFEQSRLVRSLRSAATELHHRLAEVDAA